MSSTQSALDVMTAGIMARKQERSAGLTPVGLEAKPAPLDVKLPDYAFPHDDASFVKGAVMQALGTCKEMQSHLDFITDHLEAMADQFGMKVGAAAPDPLAAQKAREQAADAAAQARFEADMDAQREAAQRATFKQAQSEGRWACPLHGSEHLMTMMSRSKREYAQCAVPGCHHYEKLR
jgi:hypothetical protein